MVSVAEEAESAVSSSPSARGGLAMKRERQKASEDVQATIAAVAATILAVVTRGVAVCFGWMGELANSIPEEEISREEAKAEMWGD